MKVLIKPHTHILKKSKQCNSKEGTFKAESIAYTIQIFQLIF